MNNYYDLLLEKATANPQKLALVVDSDRYTYSELLAAVDRQLAIAQNFAERGSTVLVLGDSTIEQLTAFLALQAIGALPILLHRDLPPADMAAIASDNYLNYLWEVGTGEVSTCLTAIARHSDADILGVLSSGSTATPHVMYRTYHSWAGFFPAQNAIFGVDAEACMFLHGSLSFTGNLNSLLSVLYEGGTVVTSERMNCHHWLRLMAENSVTCIYMVPTKLRLLVNAASAKEKRAPLGTAQTAQHDAATSAPFTLPAVRSLFTGSQLLTPAVIAGLQRLLPSGKIILYYGASELNYITYAVVDDPARDSANLGLPFPETELTFADGLIYVDTPYHVSGITTPFSVRDTGYLNERGELIFTGRREAWLNKGGVKLSLTRLTSKIESISGVESAVLLPIPDDLRGTTLAAFIVADASSTESAIRSAIRTALTPTEQPRKIIFIPAIPLNDRGKIDQPILLALINKD